MRFTTTRESSQFWRKWLFVGVALIVAIYFLHSFSDDLRLPAKFASNPKHPETALAHDANGTPLEHHETSNVMSASRCDESFPDLYRDIDRVTSLWKAKGHTIGKEDVDISFRIPNGEDGGGAMRILIHNNELRILESIKTIGHMGYRGRAVGVLHLIQRAIDAAAAVGETLPTIEAALLFQDDSYPPDEEGDTHTFWTFAANIRNEAQQRIFLMPNFDFWYAYPMGSYREAKHMAAKHDAPFTSKIPKVVWRGSGWTNWDIRGTLAEISKDKPWADIYVNDWADMSKPEALTVQDYCKYAMTVHTEGISYSGRLKYLLNCQSLLIVHELDWRTFYTHLLEKDGPNQNFVSVKRDWSDLESNVQWYLDHPEEAERVITNNIATFRNKYTTDAATSCYIRKLIHEYSSVSFTPEVERLSRDGKTMKLRGYAFERFMDYQEDKNFEESDDGF